MCQMYLNPNLAWDLCSPIFCFDGFVGCIIRQFKQVYNIWCLFYGLVAIFFLILFVLSTLKIYLKSGNKIAALVLRFVDLTIIYIIV